MKSLNYIEKSQIEKSQQEKSQLEKSQLEKPKTESDFHFQPIHPTKVWKAARGNLRGETHF